jgi:radical SAM protein with 4Fe4S-binding SPASM domain
MKKYFDVNHSLDIPKNISKRKMGDYLLYLAPENPSWVVFDYDESLIFEELRRGKSILDSEKEFVKKTNYDREKVREKTKSLLKEIEVHGFYDNNTSIVKSNRYLVHWYVTNECNLSCINCYMDAGKVLDDELTTEESYKFIDEITKLKDCNITFTGGEPLVRKDLLDVAKYAKKSGSNIALLTNGTLITDRTKAIEISEIFDFVQISLDGMTTETNDRIRGNGSFEKIKDAVNYFEGLDTKVNISTTISDKNKDDVRNNISNFIHSLDNKNINFSLGKLLDHGRGKNQKCSDSEVIVSIDEALEILYSEGWDNRRKRYRNSRTLGCAYSKCFVMGSNGDVYNCPLTYKELMTGNIRKDGVEKIVSELEKESERTSVENMACHESCELEYVCGGECRIKNHKLNGDVLKPSCEDGLKKMFYETMLNQNIKMRRDRGETTF